MKKISILLLLFSLFAFADAYLRAFHFYTIDNNVAFEYFDPVSFFEGEQKLGTDSIGFSYNGINYAFANWENQKKFADNFTDYEAEFGGWCAYDMSQARSKTIPDIYINKLIDGKLYFFSSKEKAEKFAKNHKNLAKKAQANWEIIYEIPGDFDDFEYRNEIY